MLPSDDLKDVSDVRDEVEERLYRRIEHTGRLGKMLYGVIGGALFTIISMTWWVATLNNQINGNSRYIDEEKRERYGERLHDTEISGQRRDRQIDQLNNKVFGYTP